MGDMPRVELFARQTSPGGMYGATRWSRQRASGHCGQKIVRKEVIDHALCECPNDLSKIKTKIAFNLTKRQLICFGGWAAVGVPAYLLTRQAIGAPGRCS